MAEAPKAEITRYDSLPRWLKVIYLVLTASGVGLCLLYLFGWSIRGWFLQDVMYYYLLFGIFGACALLALPARKKGRTSVIPWYDLVLAAGVFGICLYWSLNAWDIAVMGWVPPPTMLATISGGVIALVALESGRRMAGLPFAIICLIIGAYPLVAEHMPGVFYGRGFPLPHLIGSFVYDRMGMLGIPGQVIGEILLSFLIFAGMLLGLGAGEFFINLALGLLGRYRGGPAKVAVLASGLFGSISGSNIANVAITGSFTIPAMKRMGYPAHYAGAIEAVASTGGIIMPPVMGLIAFIMAILTGIPYATIAMAAIIPAFLYYWGLMVQVDAYAARVGLKGLPREEIPSLLRTLKKGLPFIAALGFLVFGLIYMRWGAIAPIYASGLLFVLSFNSRETMMTPKRIIASLAMIGNLTAYVLAILLPVSLLLVGLQLSGTLTALIAQITALGGENLPLALLIMIVVCYLAGMVGITLVAYIVIAVIAIPPLVAATGLNLLALHLFVTCYLLTAAITPPVAFSAFVAAGLAEAPFMKVARTAIRLAVVLYFFPFFFLFNPALILDGPILETLYLFTLCLVGILILAGGLEGYLLRVGKLGLWSRPLLVAGGFLIALPGWGTSIIGVALTAVVVAIILIRRKTAGKLKTSG